MAMLRPMRARPLTTAVWVPKLVTSTNDLEWTGRTTGSVEALPSPSHLLRGRKSNLLQAWFGARWDISFSLLEISLPSAGALIFLGPWL